MQNKSQFNIWYFVCKIRVSGYYCGISLGIFKSKIKEKKIQVRQRRAERKEKRLNNRMIYPMFDNVFNSIISIFCTQVKCSIECHTIYCIVEWRVMPTGAHINIYDKYKLKLFHLFVGVSCLHLSALWFILDIAYYFVEKLVFISVVFFSFFILFSEWNI